MINTLPYELNGILYSIVIIVLLLLFMHVYKNYLSIKYAAVGRFNNGSSNASKIEQTAQIIKPKSPMDIAKEMDLAEPHHRQADRTDRLITQKVQQDAIIKEPVYTNVKSVFQIDDDTLYNINEENQGNQRNQRNKGPQVNQHNKLIMSDGLGNDLVNDIWLDETGSENETEYDQMYEYMEKEYMENISPGDDKLYQKAKDIGMNAKRALDASARFHKHSLIPYVAEELNNNENRDWWENETLIV